jgi:hypothetical protein
MGHAIGEGFRRVARIPGLVALLLLVNVLSAALLAVPLARVLEGDLEHRDAAREMLHGFDFPWWSQWSDAQRGWTASFAPDVFGAGFAFKNVDLLLRGFLPAGLFVVRPPEEPGGGSGAGEAAAGIDPVILALGAAYLVLQTFLAGGLLATLRGTRGSWTFRGLLHGSGFVLLVDCALFALNGPLARWADHRAREAVSESTAHAWLLGRHAVLLLAILWVNMVSGYAKVIVVLEERSSAVLALLSALSFALRRPLRSFGHYLIMAACGVALLTVWSVVDARVETVGYATQLGTLLLAQGLMAGRIALRLALLAGQIALYRRFAGLPAEAVVAA